MVGYPPIINAPHVCAQAAVIVRGTFITLRRFRWFCFVCSWAALFLCAGCGDRAWYLLHSASVSLVLLCLPFRAWLGVLWMSFGHIDASRASLLRISWLSLDTHAVLLVSLLVFCAPTGASWLSWLHPLLSLWSLLIARVALMALTAAPSWLLCSP